jgi:hypothetical protein
MIVKQAKNTHLIIMSVMTKAIKTSTFVVKDICNNQGKIILPPFMLLSFAFD